MYRVLQFAAFPARCRCKLCGSETNCAANTESPFFLVQLQQAGAIPTCYIISMNVAILRETRENDTVATCTGENEFRCCEREGDFRTGFCNCLDLRQRLVYLNWVGHCGDMLNAFQTEELLFCSIFSRENIGDALDFNPNSCAENVLPFTVPQTVLSISFCCQRMQGDWYLAFFASRMIVLAI